MALFCIVGTLLTSCGDVEVNPGPGLSECVLAPPHVLQNTISVDLKAKLS